MNAVAFLTDFGDQAVVLPLALVTAVVFAVSGWWRGLGAWVLAVGGVLATILVLKILFAACAALGAPLDIRSPSGHTASACVVYGGLGLLLLRGRLPMPWLVLLPAGIASLFAGSRLLLMVHTPGDVVAGALVGMVGIAVLLRLSGSQPPRYRGWVVVTSLLVMAALHGLHLPAEQAIRSLAQGTIAYWLQGALACRTA